LTGGWKEEGVFSYISFIECRDVTPFFWKSTGSNHGVVIGVVIRNTPAFDADLLEGDIIKKVNDTDITGPTTWNTTLTENLGKPVVVTFIREEKEQQKTVTLRSKGQ
jgi:S1-C subfamily serine protease